MNPKTILALILAPFTAALTPDPGRAQTTWLASHSPSGELARGASNSASTSADGRFTAFASSANDLVPNDTNGVFDVFVFDRETGTVERVSTSSSGAQANDLSMAPAISADGRWVVFQSRARNLSTFDTRGKFQIHKKDRQTGTLVAVSLDSSPTSTWGDGDSIDPAISGDGSVVSFTSAATNLDRFSADVNNFDDIYVREDGSLAPMRISEYEQSQANAPSGKSAVSADGIWVAFETRATNLQWRYCTDPNGTTKDVLVMHWRGFLVQYPTWGADGDCSAPSLSANGMVVAFHSDATNLVTHDTNGVADVFVSQLFTATRERVSVTTAGAQLFTGSGGVGSTAATISGDARYVAFQSDATDLGYSTLPMTCYVRDRVLGATWRATVNEPGIEGDLSDDGRCLAFTDPSLPGKSQVKVRQWQTPATATPFGTACPGTASGHTVLPAQFQTRFAGGTAPSPLTGGPSRYQQVLLGAELPNALTIAGIALRAPSGHAAQAGGSVDIEIKVGYTTAGLVPSTSFAANWDAGPPVTVLPRTVVTLSGGTGSDDPTVVCNEVAFATPFQWQPQGFNLLIEIVTRTATPFQFAVDAGGTAAIATSTVSATSDTATTGVLGLRTGPALALRTLGGALPVLFTDPKPLHGTPRFGMHLRQARPWAPAVFMIGFSNTTYAGLTLPFPLAILGGGSCQLLVAPDVSVGLATNALGQATLEVPLPLVDVGVVGISFYVQCAVADPGANGLGLAFTNAVHVVRANG